MLDENANSSININIGGKAAANKSASKTSVNKYYNIFSKKMEEFELPDIDLEFNTTFTPEKSSFMRAT